LVECFSPQDATAIDFADRVLAGNAKANAPQSLFVVGVLRSYGCYGAASEMLDLAIAGKMDPEPAGSDQPLRSHRSYASVSRPASLLREKRRLALQQMQRASTEALGAYHRLKQAVTTSDLERSSGEFMAALKKWDAASADLGAVIDATAAV
jgi:hypothetical protein